MVWHPGVRPVDPVRQVGSDALNRHSGIAALGHAS